MDEETYEIMIEDLAFWLVNNHDACPLIFTNDQVQAKLYKYYQEYQVLHPYYFHDHVLKIFLLYYFDFLLSSQN